MKKILFISNDGSYTGAPIFLVKFVKYLIKNNKNNISILFSKSGPLSESINELDLKIINSKKNAVGINFFHKIILRILHYIRYVKLLLLFRPDLVYSNTVVNSGEVLIAGLLRIPVVLHLHEGRNVLSQFKIRLKLSCYFSHSIIAGSKYVDDVLYSLTKRRAEVAYIGVENTNSYVKRRPRSAGPFKLGMIGTINRNKGQHVAIQALKYLADKGYDIQLNIAGVSGDDKYLEEIKTFVDVNNLKDLVNFLGAVVCAADYISSLDFLLLPSFDEALPTVVLEAFSVGTIVIASNVGGVPEIIEDDVNGFLFNPGDALMLSGKLEKAINRYDLLDYLVCNAKRHVLEKFNISRNNSKIEWYIINLISKL